MSQSITFYPEGNAECVLLELGNGKRMLMDYANMHGNDPRYTDLTRVCSTTENPLGDKDFVARCDIIGAKEMEKVAGKACT